MTNQGQARVQPPAQGGGNVAGNQAQTTRDPQTLALLPVGEYTYMLLSTMIVQYMSIKQYIDMYARDVRAKETKLYNRLSNAMDRLIADIRKAVTEVAAALGMPAEFADPIKFAEMFASQMGGGKFDVSQLADKFKEMASKYQAGGAARSSAPSAPASLGAGATTAPSASTSSAGTASAPRTSSASTPTGAPSTAPMGRSGGVVPGAPVPPTPPTAGGNSNKGTSAPSNASGGTTAQSPGVSASTPPATPTPPTAPSGAEQPSKADSAGGPTESKDDDIDSILQQLRALRESARQGDNQ